MTDIINKACISMSDAVHRLKKTPAEKVVREYLRMAEMYQENVYAYRIAAAEWEKELK